MSSLSIGGAGQGLFQYLQGLSGAQQTSQATSTPSATSTQGSVGSSTPGVSGAHRHHHGGAAAFFQQLQSAVTSALQTAQPGGSSSSTDPNDVIQNAIAQVLKNIQGGTTATTGQTSTTAAASNNGASAATTVESDISSAQSTFAQLLQSNGVDPQQFQNDFLGAIQSAQQGGSIDPSSVLSNLPAGSLLDTLA
jgi:hypothetical protein